MSHIIICGRSVTWNIAFGDAKVLTKQPPPNKYQEKKKKSNKKESDSHKTEPRNTKKTAESHKKGVWKPLKKYTRRFVKWNPSFWKTQPHRFADYIPYQISITGNTIKEWTNQPFKYFRDKNIMLLNISEVMANSTYVGVAESHKGVKRVVQSHIFETTVRDIKAYIIVREYDWGDFVLHSIYDAQDFIKHVKRNSERSNTSGDATRRWTPNAISCRKSTHKIKTTKQNQEKVESNHKKWKNKQKGNKNERKTEAKRTKVPTQTPERSKSELRTQSSEQKKRGVKTPQKIYASFCEMKPIVLKKPPPHRFADYICQ